MPGSNRITSDYGLRDLDGDPTTGVNGEENWHDGTDIGRKSSDTSTLNWDYEILSSRSGTVPNDTTDDSATCGWWVRLDNGIIDGENVETKYCHMKSAPLFGQFASVDSGDHLGWMGTTPSVPKHLHFAGYFDGTAKDLENYLTRPGIDVIEDYWDSHSQYQ